MSTLKWAEDVEDTNTSKPRLQSTRTGKLRPNIPVDSALPSKNDKVGPLIATAMANTNTIAEAKQYILNSNANDETKARATELVDYGYITGDPRRSAGEINRNLANVNRMEAKDTKYINDFLDSLEGDKLDLDIELNRLNADPTLSENDKQRLKPKITAGMQQLEKDRAARVAAVKAAKEAKAAEPAPSDPKKKVRYALSDSGEPYMIVDEEKPTVGEARAAAAKEAAKAPEASGETKEPTPGEARVAKAVAAKEAASKVTEAPAEEPKTKPRILTKKQENAITKQKAKAEETLKKRLAAVAAAKAASATKPNDAENSNSEITVPENLAGTENTEDLEESPNDPTAVNSTQQTLLRIGVDSASEYIELDATKFKSTGGFNTLGLGLGQREFRQLYGMSTADEFRLMQRVFGVPRIGAKPKFVGYLDAKCLFDGIDVVKKAFKTRIGTLRAAISLNSTSNTAKRNKHFQDYLIKTLADLNAFTTPCPVESASGVGAPVTTVTAPVPTTVASTTGSSGCPCLTDINLLRDLVYVLALVQGNASPELKKQIAAIPMNRILNITKASNTTTFLPQVREALIALLRVLREAPAEGAGAVNVSAITGALGLNKGVGLEGVLKHLRELSAELDRHKQLLKECQEAQAKMASAEAEAPGSEAEAPEADEPEGPSLDALTAPLAAARAKVAEAEAAQAAVEAEINALREALAKATADASGSAAATAALQQQLTDKEGELAGLRDTLATVRGELEQAKARVAELTTAAGEVEALRAAVTASEAEKTGLRAQIDELQKQLAAKSGKEAKALQEQLAGVQAELAQVNKLFETQLLELTKKNAELEALRKQLAKLQKEKNSSNTRATVAEEKAAAANVATADAAAARREAAAKQAELDKSTAALGSKEAELAAAVAQITALTKALEDSSTEAAASTEVTTAAAAAKLAAKETELAASRANAAKAKEEAAAQLAKIQEELATAKAALTALQGAASSTEAEKADLARQVKEAEANVKALQAQLATATSTGSTQTAAFDTERKGLEAEIGRLKAQLAEVNGAAEAARRECAGKVDTLTGQLATLTGQLASAEAEQKKAVEATKQSAAADAAAKLAQATTEHEAKVAELTKEIDKVKKELATATAALAACDEKDRVIQAKNAEIATLKANSAAKNAKVKSLTEASAEKNTEIAGLKGSLAEALARAGTGEASTAELGKLKGQLAEAQTLSASLQASLAKLEAEKKSAAVKTQEGLQTALAQLAISKEHQAAMTKLLQGDKSALIDIQRETCNFFLYLYDLINMQIRDIDGLKIPGPYKKNIFDFYRVTSPLPDVDKQELLSEITSVFQEFFIAFQKNIGTTPKGFELQRKYPLLTSIVSKIDITDSQVCKTTGEATKLRAELQRFGHLYAFGIEPEDEAQQTFHIISGVKDPFCDNTTKYVPLGILAIRFIQLVHETFDSRYLELKARCAPLENTASTNGSSVPPEPSNSGSEGSGATPTTFEELEEEEEEEEASQQGAARPAPCKRKSPLE